MKKSQSYLLFLIFCPPKKLAVQARARRKRGVGGIPPRPSRSEAPPPALLRAEASKKVFFTF